MYLECSLYRIKRLEKYRLSDFYTRMLSAAEDEGLVMMWTECVFRTLLILRLDIHTMTAISWGIPHIKNINRIRSWKKKKPGTNEHSSPDLVNMKMICSLAQKKFKLCVNPEPTETFTTVIKFYWYKQRLFIKIIPFC
ncbi:uncharacterized protein LOC143231825 [Tachypleus tridentatus]|uniref:uncharacterized protein LOC143231825 n=1 Tax=Tachypleus tridentatus TaxID=6853 RepID=UPI003FD300B1